MLNICSEIDDFDLTPRDRKVKKSEKSIYSVKINHFELPARGRKVEKSNKIQYIKENRSVWPPSNRLKSQKNPLHSVKLIISTFHQEVEQSKKSYIFSKINHYELPPIGQKSKSRKNPIHSATLINLNSQQEVEKCKRRKNPIYLVKSISLTS